jgi:hypothetical protein
MNHSVQLTDAQRRKLLNGRAVQLKSHHLVGGGSLISLGKMMSNKVNKAIQKGLGIRICLTDDEINHNAKHNDDFRRLLSKARAKRMGLNNCDDEYDEDDEDDEEFNGGSLPNVNRSFRNFGKTLNRAIVKPINDNVIKVIDNNKQGIARILGGITMPLASSILKKATGGLDFSGGNKIASKYIDRRINRDLGPNKQNIVSVNNPVPSNQPQQITMDNSQVDPNQPIITNGSGFITRGGCVHRGGALADGMVGFSMVKRRQPIGKPKPHSNVINVNNGYNGNGLYPSGYSGRGCKTGGSCRSGQGLYPSGY